MTDREFSEITVEEVAALGAMRLAKLVLDHAWHNPALAKAIERTMAARSAPDVLAERLRSEIEDIQDDDVSIDYHSVPAFVDELEGLHSSIVNAILPDHPRVAAELLEAFIRLDETVFERCDDDNGQVHSLLVAAVDDFGQAWTLVPDRDVGTLAEQVLDLYLDDPFSVRSHIFQSFQAALGDAGMAAAEAAIRRRLQALPQTDSRDPAGGRPWLLNAMRRLAEVTGDVDTFIESHTLDGSETRNARKIAKRLIDVGRHQEALDRLEAVPDPDDDEKNGIDALRADTLELLGRTDDAQQVRWALFTRTLDTEQFKKYVARVSDDADAEQARIRSTALARDFPRVGPAFSFLTATNPAAAGELVLARIAEIRRNRPTNLERAAQTLAPVAPLAAVLILRILVDDIVDPGRSDWYDAAVRHFVAADKVAAGVTDWQGHADQAGYRARLKATHGRKYKFWKLLAAVEQDR